MYVNTKSCMSDKLGCLSFASKAVDQFLKLCTFALVHALLWMELMYTNNGLFSCVLILLFDYYNLSAV